MDETSRPRPDPAPGAAGAGRHAAPPRRRSRRWFLAGGLAVVAGAGAGVGAEYVRDDHSPALPPAPPAVLVQAAAAERALIADLTATTGGTPAVRLVIEQARADHRAHLAALDGVLAAYRKPTATASPAPGSPRTVAQLRAAELTAAAAAARRASGLTGARAALLASISACESTHAELLGLDRP